MSLWAMGKRKFNAMRRYFWGGFVPPRSKIRESRGLESMSENKLIKAEEVEAWEWGYVCPECGTEMEVYDRGEDQFDKRDKEAYVEYECKKCKSVWSALYSLVSLMHEYDIE